MAELDQCIPNPNAVVDDWTSKNETQPFLNLRTCELSIVVDKGYNDIDNPDQGTSQNEAGGSDNELIKKYTAYGVDKLLEYYDKVDPTYLDVCLDLASSDILVSSLGHCTRHLREQAQLLLEAREASSPGSSYYISPRPQSPMKVLVTIPVNTFNKIPQNPPSKK